MTQPNLHQSLQLAVRHHQAGRLAEAEAVYRRILSAQPNHADALHLLGMIETQTGNLDSAKDLIGKSISLNPALPEAHNNLGIVLMRLGNSPAAAEAYLQAIQLKPDYADAFANLGVALMDQKKVDEAIAACRTAIQLDPRDAEPHCTLGGALLAQNKLDEAAAEYLTALRLQPDHSDAFYNLAGVHHAQGKLDDAVVAYSRAIDLQSDFAEAYYNMAIVLAKQRKLDQAVAAYSQAIRFNSAGEPMRLASMYGNLGNVLKDQGRVDDALNCLAKAVELDPSSATLHSNLCLTMLYDAASTPQSLLNEARRFAERHAEPLATHLRPNENDRSPDRRLKIGYLSPDFREHPVGRMIAPLLASHDHQSFEIHCYANASGSDAVTQRIRTYADHWHEIVVMSDEDLADQIREDRIDILVDLAAHTAGNRLLVFAAKPAPVQVTWFPGTTGLRTIDYRLTDSYFDPPGAEYFYTEQSIHLRSFWCFEPRETPGVSPLSALKTSHITFASLNNFAKINPPTLQLWLKIMRDVPHSHLLLKCDAGKHRDAARELFRAGGISPDRIEFVGHVSEPEYFQLYRRIDIGLDSFPFNGHTTTFDFLWMGVPVISLAGGTCVGRAGASVLSNLGMPELIARSPEEYAGIAVKMANDQLDLTNIRATLRQRLQGSVLMDGPGYAREIESKFRQIWLAWCGKTRDG